MALPCSLSLICPTLISAKHLVVGRARSVWAISCTTLLCWLVRRLFMYLIVQHESKCRHVSFSLVEKGYIVRKSLVTCLKTCFSQ